MILLLALALDLLDAQGARHRLEDYRGKVVVVNFWATWCEPCREELPSLERLRAAFEGRGLVVLGVQMGGSARTAQDKAEELGVHFPLLIDRDSSVTKGWKVKLLPTTIVFGRDGKRAFRQEGAVDWSAPKWRRKIERLFGH